MGWALFIITLLALIASMSKARRREGIMDSVMEMAQKRIHHLTDELTETHLSKRKALDEAFKVERGAIALRSALVRDESHMRWVIRDDRLAEKDTTGDGLRLLKGPCAEETADDE